MLLAVDIGNTEVGLGIFEGDELRSTWRMATDTHRTPDEYAATLLALLQHQGLQASDVQAVALCSVVPPMVAPFDDLCQRYFKVEPLIVGAGIKTGVRIRMDNPREVGADRIVNAAVAHHMYGAPVIIVDMGTATTFDTVSKEGDYIGGAIAPGLVTAAEALFARTAKLSKVELVRPKRAIGTNTIAAMQSGLIFGYIGLVEGVVARIQKELGEKAKVVATGGMSRQIGQETPIFDVINPELTLMGLKLIYKLNQD